MTANDYYLMGNEWRRKGDFQRALNCYMEATDLDADSPARVAREMLEDILSFYCRDYYNP